MFPTLRSHLSFFGLSCLFHTLGAFFTFSKGGGSTHYCFTAPPIPGCPLMKLSWHHFYFYFFSGSFCTWLLALWKQEICFSHYCILRNQHHLWRRISINKYILNWLGIKIPIYSEFAYPDALKLLVAFSFTKEDIWGEEGGIVPLKAVTV